LLLSRKRIELLPPKKEKIGIFLCPETKMYDANWIRLLSFLFRIKNGKNLIVECKKVFHDLGRIHLKNSIFN